MRRTLAAALALLCLALGAVPAAVAGGQATGIKGVVLDATCPGPCRYPHPPLPPYRGPGLTVAVRSPESGRLLVRLHPTDGRFEVRLAPGSYGVSARVGRQPSCWRGDAKTVRVLSGLRRVRLRVANVCVL
ncbi:MAG: hypothetical protein U0R52_10920 [Solirubrobacterales bacterium]